MWKLRSSHAVTCLLEMAKAFYCIYESDIPFQSTLYQRMKVLSQFHTRDAVTGKELNCTKLPRVKPSLETKSFPNNGRQCHVQRVVDFVSTTMEYICIPQTRKHVQKILQRSVEDLHRKNLET
ncbi:hypothetical protein TNCV_3830951 [Trichonephila clavipes]|nr:hypothetical protein TNCV_3830951 [Trichonephila clavipes]